MSLKPKRVFWAHFNVIFGFFAQRNPLKSRARDWHRRFEFVLFCIALVMVQALTSLETIHRFQVVNPQCSQQLNVASHSTCIRISEYSLSPSYKPEFAYIIFIFYLYSFVSITLSHHSALQLAAHGRVCHVHSSVTVNCVPVNNLTCQKWFLFLNEMQIKNE